MSTLAIRLVILGLILVGAALFVKHYFNIRDDNKVLVADNSTLITKSDNTDTQVKDLGEERSGQTYYEGVLGTIVQEQEVKFEEVKKHDEDTRNWADQPIPQRLRDLEPEYCPYPCIPKGAKGGVGGIRSTSRSSRPNTGEETSRNNWSPLEP